MQIKIARLSDPKPSEITPESTYWNRRQWLSGLGYTGAMLALTGSAASAQAQSPSPWEQLLQQKLASTAPDPDPIDETLTPYEDVIRYNNFYEFGTGKGDPVANSKRFKVEPWSVRIDGAVQKPFTLQLEDLIKPHALQERIYRFRCVEAWSMVVPWVGFPLAELISRCEPTASAKYLRFETLVDPQRFPAQGFGRSTIPWPYVEGLRMDEAQHPLSLMVVGVYGKVLPAQNGAPLRLMVPWKYGFKSIKSIVRISFLEQQPPTTWERLASQEYGFYANVNPEVDHPRWSQKRERRLPNSLFDPNWIPTRKFNGYENEVAHLYAGMNLRKLY
jgi:sulfoxide reductase catalytic subunit YedY